MNEPSKLFLLFLKSINAQKLLYGSHTWQKEFYVFSIMTWDAKYHMSSAKVGTPKQILNILKRDVQNEAFFSNSKDASLRNGATKVLPSEKQDVDELKKSDPTNLWVISFNDEHIGPSELHEFNHQDLVEYEIYLRKLQKEKAKIARPKPESTKLNLPTQIYNKLINIVRDRIPNDHLIDCQDTSVGAINDLILGCQRYIKYYQKRQIRRTLYDYTNVNIELYGLQHILMCLKRLNHARVQNIYEVNWKALTIKPLTINDLKHYLNLNDDTVHKFIQWIHGSKVAKQDVMTNLSRFN
ncbi:hypothetical protein [Acetilactobacillus jinshanensis]|uniref:Uncharacterized protein n=1 Tax=Acetilactobacillus jinshanensis TaxID=1720083 RepID=A0A4P6ZKY6_9LACO|nr:hypothetical protein [Acetilactobacillus jinshanensis]QBP18481.1 hypothetical protein ELX58_04880 [Acetilactobacillus jinshanensis]URL61352.1 hypothetical protein HGK75_04995 [uncultured bacterium]